MNIHLYLTTVFWLYCAVVKKFMNDITSLIVMQVDRNKSAISARGAMPATHVTINRIDCSVETDLRRFNKHVYDK